MSRHLLIGPAVAALLAGGCAAEFKPPSYLDDLRVLAIVSSPPEVGPGEEATLSPHVYLPPGETLLSSSWSYCPFSLGAAAGFSCALETCQVTLTPGVGGQVSLEPQALATQCAAKLLESGASIPADMPAGGTIPSRIEATVTLSLASSSGARREAVARLPVWTLQTPQPRNRPPVIQRVEIGGAAVPTGSAAKGVRPDEARTVRVVVDPTSIDSFTDASGRSRVEEPIISFFATAGRFEHDREAGQDVSVSWRAEELEPGQREAALYIVARDLRGGQAVAGPFTIPIQR